MEKRYAHSLEGLPDCDGEVTTYTVGIAYYRALKIEGDKSPQRLDTNPVTEIVIECDLPGQNAFMERAKVYDTNGLVFEAPVANLGGIHYITS